jgi:ATP-dependent Clp protease ATP-binding subunit ClpA
MPAMALPHYHRESLRLARLAGLLAARAGAAKVEPEHLLVALLGPRGILTAVLADAGIDREPLWRDARALAAVDRPTRRSKPRISRRMEDLLTAADAEAASFCETSVQPAHLLLALLKEGGPASRFLLMRLGDYSKLRLAVRKVLHLRTPWRCRVCGYDLRATPVRCPECGTEV